MNETSYDDTRVVAVIKRREVNHFKEPNASIDILAARCSSVSGPHREWLILQAVKRL